MGKCDKKYICHNSIKGIGLIELSFFITAFGLMVAAAAPFYTIYENQKKLAGTNETLGQVKTALNAYYQQYGYLPCPAPRNAPYHSSTFGAPSATPCSPATVAAPTAPVELGDGTARADGRQIPVTTGTYWPIRIGAVPVRALGLPDSAAVDQWGNFLTYAVTEQYAVKGSAPGDMLHGAINIVDSSTANSVTASPGIAVFAIIAPGADSRGAWNPENGMQMASGAEACPGVTSSQGSTPNSAGGSTAYQQTPEGSAALPIVAYNCDDYKKGSFVATTKTSNDGTKSFTNMVAYSAGSQACSALTTAPGVGNVAILVATNGTMGTPVISTVPGQACAAAPSTPPVTGSVTSTPPGSPSIPAPCAGLTGMAAITCGIAQASAPPSAGAPAAAPTVTASAPTTSGICHKLETVNGTCCFEEPVVCFGTTAGDVVGSFQAKNNISFTSEPSNGTGSGVATPVSGPLGDCTACGATAN